MLLGAAGELHVFQHCFDACSYGCALVRIVMPTELCW